MRKIEEHKKKLKEEKQIEELKKLQVEAGLIPASHLQRMEWMYNAAQSKLTTAEEYLLGKPIEEDRKNTEKLSKDKFQTIIKETNINEENEEFVKFHEDPLVYIVKQNLKAKQSIVDNPYEMKKLIAEIQELKRSKHKHRRHHHKHHHKHHHRHHHKEEEINYDENIDIEDEMSSSNSRSRSRIKDRLQYKLYRRIPEELSDSSMESPMESPMETPIESPSETKNNDDLGPSGEFKRLREQNKIIDDFNYKSSNSKIMLSEEQREQRLREMRENAERIENERLEQYKKDEEFYMKNKNSKPTNILLNFSHDLYDNNDGTIENGIKRKGNAIQKLASLNKNE